MLYRLCILIPVMGCTAISSADQSETKSFSVPWFHQLDIPEIGWAACSSASSAMVLAYHGYIEPEQQSLINTAETIFTATSDPEWGLLGRDGLADFLMSEWGLSMVTFEYPSQQELYALIREEITAERPLILGTRSINSYGHYMVITGYNGSNYQNATLTLNDPYGLWLEHDDWCDSCSGKGVTQDFTTFAANQETDGVFVLQP